MRRAHADLPACPERHGVGCIVGSGPAGPTLAIAFAGAGRRAVFRGAGGEAVSSGAPSIGRPAAAKPGRRRAAAWSCGDPDIFARCRVAARRRFRHGRSARRARPCKLRAS